MGGIPCEWHGAGDPMLSGNQISKPNETTANCLPETLKMKPISIILLTFCLCLTGCGKKEQAKTPPIDPSKHERFLWAFETGSHVTSSPAIGSDGTVYVGSTDKKLYAIKTNSKGLAKSPWPMRGQNARHTGRVIKK